MFRDADAFTKSGVKSISIDSLTASTIGTYAFSYCSDLTSVTVTGHVESIGAYAFSYCPSLKELNIEGTVGTIGTCTCCGLRNASHKQTRRFPRLLLSPPSLTQI